MTDETAALIREMRDLIADAHDTHIYAEDDPHPATCPYCHAVQWANRLLTTHNKEPL